MKTKISLILAGLFLAACATTEVSDSTMEAETAPVVTTEEAVDATEADTPDCDPTDTSCDHTGTTFRPPNR